MAHPAHAIETVRGPGGPQARSGQPPAYRRKVVRGKAAAVVTLPDRSSGRRHDYWLGPYGSPESRAKYAALLEQWERAGHRLPDPDAVSRPTPRTRGYTVRQLCADWTLSNPARVDALRPTLRVLIECAGGEPAHLFGSRRLREVRDAMVRGNAESDPPRPKWSRQTCNRRTREIAAVFRWAVAEEIIPPTQLEMLRALAPLRLGETSAHENRRRAAVDDARVNATLPHLPTVVRAMVAVQRATGARPSEICSMRAEDVDRSGAIWRYVPHHHKSEHLGRSRVIFIGPRGQAVLAPLLERRDSGYLFPPGEAVAELLARRRAVRATPEGRGNGPGTNRSPAPRRSAGERYDKDSYARAIQRACDAAGIDRWHPYQLRHTFATEAEQRCGPEAASILLGHGSEATTERNYIHRQAARGEQAAAVVG